MLSVLRKKRGRQSRVIQTRTIYINLNGVNNRFEIFKIIDDFTKDKDIDVYDLQNYHLPKLWKGNIHSIDKIWIDVDKLMICSFFMYRLDGFKGIVISKQFPYATTKIQNRSPHRGQKTVKTSRFSPEIFSICLFLVFLIF